MLITKEAMEERKEKEKEKGEMNSGPTWADQWDNQNPDPPPQTESETDKKKEKDGSKNTLGKKLLSLRWMKELKKKSQKGEGK
ncbi:uncharacterized protein LOC122725245 [Manihot esculenta]|uniref:Uncharacterized protein n=2 Tax=Manihot esculenta TaxID=3983 RepID=A0ACB7GMS4_MANES|nr:uncharacterized protein LOC122725245 [Manihot esculenta]KAG8641657.1 hypothetical protein MANES_12G016200v8 [Manihot esculenta]